MGELLNNIIGSGEFSEVVIIGSVILISTVTICLIDLVYRLFRNFWRGKS